MSPAVQVLAAAVLAVVVLGEIDAPAPDERAPAPASRTVARGGPAPAATDQSPRWVSIALARPIFSPDRRPPRRAAGAVASAAGGPVLPRLAGIIIDPAGGVAIFAPAAAGEKPQAVPVGGKLDAWTVLNIGPREVRVRGPEGESTLHVAFDVATTTAPAPGAGAFPLPALRNRPINLHPMQQRRGNEAE